MSTSTSSMHNLNGESDSDSDRTVKIAICGGGLGGLMLAHVITYYLKSSSAYNDHLIHSGPDHDGLGSGDSDSDGFRILVDIYESAPEFSAVGAGILVWSRTYETLREVGLEEAFRGVVGDDVDQPSLRFTYRYGMRPEGGEDIYKFYVPQSDTNININLHRAEFLKLLTDAIQPSIDAGVVRVHFNRRLKGYSYTESSSSNTSASKHLTLTFSDSTSTNADILIGADGVRSATRASLYTHFASCKPPESEECKEMMGYVEPSWSGTFAYRALVDPEKLRGGGGRDEKLREGLGGGRDGGGTRRDGEHRREHRSASAVGGVVYWGRDEHVITYPISHGKLINVIGYISDFKAEGLKLSSTGVGGGVGVTVDGGSTTSSKSSTDTSSIPGLSESDTPSPSPTPTPAPAPWYAKYGDPIPMLKETSNEEILEHFRRGVWEEDVVELFGCITTLSRWAITVVRDLPYLYDHEELGGWGRVAILGDAAHAMAPFCGAGVGQAVEDAYILGRLLTHPSILHRDSDTSQSKSKLKSKSKAAYLSSISRALKIYEQTRLPAIRRAFENTRACGMIFEGYVPGRVPVSGAVSGAENSDSNSPGPKTKTNIGPTVTTETETSTTTPTERVPHSHSPSPILFPENMTTCARFDGRTASMEELGMYGAEIHRLYSWQWREPYANEELWEGGQGADRLMWEGVGVV